MTTGNFIDVDGLDSDDYSAVLDMATPMNGVLITEGTESAKIILEAFPKEGYSVGDAEELRDLILQFNKAHYLSPTTL